MTKVFKKKILTKDDLRTLTAVIAEAEKATSGEIRVVVRHRRLWGEKKLALHDLALKEFHRLGMHKTHGGTGVLILLLLSERKFHIVADAGIHSKVEDGTWDRIAARMSAHFGEGKFVHGLSEAIRSVGKTLAEHFPRRAGDKNELPDEIIEE